MNFQVFGCPNCEQPFQVAAAQAGQVVQCPSCAQAVEIPKSAFGEVPQQQDPAPEPHQIFDCPACKGQFGITSEMLGQHVACPHCQASILIANPEPDPETLPPQIVTDRTVPKGPRNKKSLRKSAPQDPEAMKDLFAPGFKGKVRPSKQISPDPAIDHPTPSRPSKPSSVAKPETPSSSAETDAAKEKQRWRSPKKSAPEKERQTTNKPPQKPSLHSKPASSKPEKKQLAKPPAPTAGSKTKRHALDATVELDDRPDAVARKPTTAKSPESKSPALKKADAVEPTVALTPTTNVKKTTSQIDAPPATDTKPVPKTSPKPDARIEKTGQSIVTAEPAIESNDQPPPGIVDAAMDIQRSDPIDHLLPPRFDVLDPSQMRVKAGKTEFKVLLPDGKGGMAQVDQRIIRVEHDGERVSLVAMTPEQKSRRRLIQNIIAILIGIAVMWLAFSLLT